ncbi:CAAX geranylgeranyltransferase alpha subunit [Onygenales sp. PD_10]|nr:CAAX geranylgeranyltransferase alpha subunit [Onygenales sp. PD_10]
MSKYATPTWSNITPIPLDDGSTHYDNPEHEQEGSGNGNGTYPLATIAYSVEYEEATAYLRAVMAADEMSERALQLTEDVILLNPAHYTVWLYRAKILSALEKDLNKELEWVNKLAMTHLKNYQIWHHRQLIISNTTIFPTLPAQELPFLKQMFALDSKNYHVWTYRHWLVRHFKLWDHPQELADTEALIDADVRNNSAWNHRWVLKFGPRGGVDAGMPLGTDEKGQRGSLDVVDEDLVDGEIEYVKGKILLAPENRSPWGYLRGLVRAAGREMGELEGFAKRFILEEVEGEGGDGGTGAGAGEVKYFVKSSLAVEWLADVYAAAAAETETETQEGGKGKGEAVKMFMLLREKYDPIRKNYWDYRIRMLGGEAAGVA